MSVVYTIADYNDAEQAKTVVSLLNAYAQDPMGGGESLSEYTQQHLAATLAKTPGAFSVIAYLNNEPIGLANCFMGFSTFACKPLVNIHDLAVLPQSRGQRVGQGLIDFVAKEAQRRGCCKVTLEVLEGNHLAKSVYDKCGFQVYTLDDTSGGALFMQKKLP